MSNVPLRNLIVGVILAVVAAMIVFFVYREVTKNPLAELPKEESSEPDISRRRSAPVRQGAPRRPADLDQYVTSQACSECHSSICSDYHSHPMSRSLSRTMEASPLEDYEATTAFDGLRSTAYQVQFSYEVNRSETQVTHAEKCLDQDGTELFRVSAPIEYSVGSGQRGRSYLIDRDGMLYMSPITWYTEGQRWDLSPAYFRNNKHFERRIVDGCVNCHAGLPNPAPEAEHTYLRPTFLEESIGCERCHGPAAGHISFHKDKQQGVDPIVNPARLPPQKRDSVCFQCHLQGAGRIVRHGQSEFGFRPGDDITKIWAVFVKGSKVDDANQTQAVGQSEQMLVSKCYTQSDGALGCLSCHDPHKLPGTEERDAFYQERCLSCHATAALPDCSRKSDVVTEGVTSDSCIACHMPKLAANDVPHTSQTDHRIPRHRLTGPVVGAEMERAGLYVFGNENGAIPENEVSYYRALLMVQNAEGSSDRFMALRAISDLQAWVDTHPYDVRALESLGTAYWITRDLDAARTVWKSGIALEPDSEILLLRLMVLSHDTGDLAAGIHYGQKLVVVNPWHAEHHARLAHMLGQAGRMPEAIDAARKAIELAPWDFQVQGWLAEALRISGNVSEAARHQALYEKLRPLEDR